MNKITGIKGFLLRNTLKEFSKFNDCIVHFGSPSCTEEFTEESTKQMVEDTKELLKLPHKNFIFASSMGTEYKSDNKFQQMYNNAKVECEILIKSSDKNYCILKIPRVYGSDRKKGLMKAIRNGTIDDYSKEIEFLDINDFKEQIKDIKVNYNIIYFNKTQKKTIKEIKEIYNL